MFSKPHTRILGYAIAGLLPFFSACGDGDSGIIDSATLDPESVVAALTPTVTGFSTDSTGEPGASNGDPDETGENTGEVVLLRSGLEDVLGHNKLVWTYTSNEVPPVTERYFFQEQNIVLNEKGEPQLIQFLPPIGSGIVVLYMELGDGNYGIHMFGRIYQDKSIVVNMFASRGNAQANGIFVYCPSSGEAELEACIGSILTEWDGTMTYERSPDPIAITDAELSGAHVSNPAEVAAWMQFARDGNPKVQTHAAFQHKEAPAAVKAISAAIAAHLSL